MTVTTGSSPTTATHRRTAGLVVVAVSASFGVALWLALWLPSYTDTVASHGPLSSEFSTGESFSCPPLADAPFTFSSPIGEVTYARQPCKKGRSRRLTVLAVGEGVTVLVVAVGVGILLAARRPARS